ncbi:hypothetical protein FACS1894130_11760 [Spirochaetia bacterium]|nr:hypothetical protein FACS1894130_11760 [Spirochaetia bacterium]
MGFGGVSAGRERGWNGNAGVGFAWVLCVRTGLALSFRSPATAVFDGAAACVGRAAITPAGFEPNDGTV